jgi:D-glycero-alpha-D-manno-heptose-7-phosphate kinase
MEIVESVDQIRHPIFREALKMVGINKNIELHSTADVPSSSGLGSSSCFTVALMNALHCYKGEYLSKLRLAEEACQIEIDLLGEPIGKQDQYMAAFGGLTCLTFEKDGNVLVEPLHLNEDVLEELESNLLFFFTGKERSASEILKEQDDKSKQNDTAMVNNLHQIKDIGFKTRECLEKGDVDMLGELLHAHWETKKKRSQKMSDPFIDECYELARKKGALGGKLMGAGGGGFFMFYCQNGEKYMVTQALRKMGLRRERLKIDWEGTRIMLNSKESVLTHDTENHGHTLVHQVRV